MHAKLLQLCLTLCDPMDCSPLGSRQEYWNGLPCPSPGNLLTPTSLMSPALAGGFFTTSAIQATDTLLRKSTGHAIASGFPAGSDGKASAGNAGDLGSIPRLERSPGEGNGNPLQYSCLENLMDGGTW